MRNLMPAAVAALSFGTVWTVGSFGLEALISPPAPVSLPASADPQADPSRSMRGKLLPDPIGTNRPGTRSCEDDAQASAECLQQERGEPPKPAGAYRPAKQLGPLRQFASRRPATVTDWS